MKQRIETIPAKKLVGIGSTMSRLEDRTPALWQELMPRREEIVDRAGDSFISMRVYRTPGMAPEEMFAPSTRFEKWAAVEVASFASTPAGMRQYTLDGGLYAVFVHTGPASAFAASMRHIFEAWLPQSGYELDDREHFEVIPPGWKATDPNATEEIWLPIRPVDSSGTQP